MIRLIVVDIEGTTTSVSFVFDVLFPYFRENISLLKTRLSEPEIAAIVQQVKDIVKSETRTELSDQEAIAQLHQWSVEDRKIAPLKAAQGILWEEGFKKEDFQGHIYEDVPRNLKKWQQQGIQLGVYSSGSAHAQKLLFGYSQFGDLTPYFNWNFDLKIGSKKEAASYQAIAQQTGFAPAEILFLSDVKAELDAAQAADLQTIQLVRPGTSPTEGHPQVNNFDEINLETFEV